MLLTAEDLAKSINELDGREDVAVTSDAEPGGKRCPRCDGELELATVTVGKMRLYGRLFHCARDGVWVPQPVLAGAFALASRNAHAGSAHNTRAYGGVSGGTTSGLAISHWYESRPRVHTLFVSAFKDRTLGCPACKDTRLEFRGDRWACNACGGCFVEDAALSAMVTQMTNQPWEVPAIKGGPGERACPVCKEPMLVEVLEAVTIDRCAGHGVYFDPDELQTALAHAAEPHHVGSLLKRLFHRHGKPED